MNLSETQMHETNEGFKLKIKIFLILIAFKYHKNSTKIETNKPSMGKTNNKIYVGGLCVRLSVLN